MMPIEKDLVAAAPTYPITISIKESGADNNSYVVPMNLGK